ncbi:MAG: hypothetical protein K6G03_09150 [Lachnospiraceae bacterium]|nr:hypothetical protein [Lachnospiraceae bacterium]
MSVISEINPDNRDEFAFILGNELVLNIARKYYRAVGAYDDKEENITGALMWKFSDLEEETATKAELVFFSAEDEETGRELLKFFLEKIDDVDANEAFFELTEASEKELNLLLEAGFTIEETEGKDIIVPLSEVSKNYSAKRRSLSFVVPFSKLNTLQYRQGITNCLFSGDEGLDDDLAFLPMDWFEKDVSCGVVIDGKVCGMCLIHLTADGMLMPVLLYATGINARLHRAILLDRALRSALKKYPRDTGILIRRNNYKTRSLVKVILPGKKGITVKRGERVKEG